MEPQALVWNTVGKRYGSSWALRGVQLTAEAGKITVLIGPSGCGKSTLLRLMVGLTAADEGHVLLGRTRLNAENVLQLRRRMGYVIQEGGLFPHLTARGNTTLMADYLDWEKDRVRGRVQELASLVKLAPDLLDRFPSQLSGGQRQRVSLMRALMLDPHVLLFDEPLGALDPMIRADLQKDLKRIFQTLKKTVVMVTHDIGEAGFFSDRLVLLREGCIIQEGTLSDLVHRPADPFVTSFINAQRSPLETLEP